MTHSRLLLALICTTLMVLTPSALGQLNTVSWPRELNKRLNSLTPDDPDPYLQLAEEIASEAQSPSAIDLARHLYVLAFELDRRTAFTHSTGASACLGLAEMASSEHDRRWLIAMAAAVDTRYAGINALRTKERARAAKTELRAAQTLGLVRAGRGPEARRELADPRVRDVLERYETVMSPTGQPGELWNIERTAETIPDLECNGDRIVLLPANKRDKTTHKLCPLCLGDPGPRLTDSQLLAQLRLEWTLLHSRAESWTAQLAIDNGAPLREADPESLANTFGFDPQLTVYREGSWAKP